MSHQSNRRGTTGKGWLSRGLALGFSVLLGGWMVPAAGAAEPEELGHVSFPTSCSTAVQPEFERGLALLHSFWFTEGARTFEDVLAKDPTCAIATWGTASILIGNTFSVGPSPQAAQKAQAALARGQAIGAKTQREKDYLEAVSAFFDHFADKTQPERMKALSAAYTQLAARYPADDEAQIFHALYLSATQSPADKSFAPTLAAAAILEKQFTKHPDHPGVAHYLIHAYDYPPIAAKGESAARRYAAIAPSAPHAQHMPSHIFTRIGLWQESVDSNTKAAVLADNLKEYSDALHAMDYLVYALLQLGRDAQAATVIAAANGVPPSNPASPAGPYSLAAIPARYAIERGMWKEAAALPDRPSTFPYTDAMRVFARGLGAARSGDPDTADKAVAALAQIRDQLKVAKSSYWANEVEIERVATAAWAAHARGKDDEALTLARQAADQEDASEKSALTPGRLIPAHELLGDLLRELKHPADALAAYEQSLAHDPNRYRGLYGAAESAQEAGNAKKAHDYFERLAKLGSRGDPLPELKEAHDYLAAH